MPIKIIEGLPVKEKLEKENIYTIDMKRATSQDIRPLRVLIVNLMPKKEDTELQLLRLLGNSPIQLDIDFIHMSSHTSKNTNISHLQKYYHTFDEIHSNFYDGMIVTGAPVEHLPFNEVTYYQELKSIIDWAQTHVFSRFYICWSAQFALNYHFHIEKNMLDKKLFGVYEYNNLTNTHPYLRGFDDTYKICQSRHTKMESNEIFSEEALDVLTSHEIFGPDIITSKDNRDLFIFGHLEYDRETLKEEYDRDIARGLTHVQMPKNYFYNDNPHIEPPFIWKSYGHLLFNNWINYTYQETPYVLKNLLNM